MAKCFPQQFIRSGLGGAIQDWQFTLPKHGMSDLGCHVKVPKFMFYRRVMVCSHCLTLTQILPLLTLVPTPTQWVSNPIASVSASVLVSGSVNAPLVILCFTEDLVMLGYFDTTIKCMQKSIKLKMKHEQYVQIKNINLE